MKSLAIVSTHPIQYYSPLFRLLAKQEDLRVKVYYDHIPDAQTQGAQFDCAFTWDVDLLSGYDYAVGKLGAAELRGMLQERAYSAVLLNGWHCPYLWRWAFEANINQTHLMVRGDSHLKTPRPLLKRLAKDIFYRSIFSTVDACLSVGSWNAEYFQYYGISRNRIFNTPHCVDNDWFSTQTARVRPSRKDVRSKWGISESDFVFSYMGKLIEIKNPGDFVEAVCIAHRSDSEIRGFVVGEGKLRGELESKVRDSGAPVTFTGFMNQREIIEAYIASDCLVLPGRETWGLVVNEAMASDLPCLVSDQAGCSIDMIVPGKNGLIFNCGNPRDLAAKMRHWKSSMVSNDQIKAANNEILRKHSCSKAVCGILQALSVC